jgi:hypothetical protein
VNLNTNDTTILRRLAERLAAAAAEPVNAERAALWTRLNDLEPVRPLVWINEVPWNELDVDGELTPRCTSEWARGVEGGLRALLYHWNHFPADMIVSDYLASPLAVHSTGLGLDVKEDILQQDPTSGVVSHRFYPQITSLADVAKIRDPVVTHDAQATAVSFQALQALFGDILPVRREGIRHLWYSPWDTLIRWWGVEQAMIDLVDRPELVHAAVARYEEASLRELDQYERLNALATNNGNVRIGSGGYGYTRALPGPKFDPAYVRPHNMWGCSNSQIFAAVSPEMHWEFAIKHDMPWLTRWGLTYYGCCEPLDGKLEILKRIPNLRKISMSPLIDVERGVAAVGDRYVFSYKPNPAILAEDRWNPERARRELRAVLEKARGCRVEIIMKDVSTVRYQPQRLWEWSRIAVEEARRFE